MNPYTSPVALTRDLLMFITINPPGNENDCAHFLGGLLEAGGFFVYYHEFAPNRTSLIAEISGKNGKAPICFTGHIDTVPLGKSKWAKDPFRGEVSGGKLYGRGSSDMKSGVAAMVLAALKLAGTPNRKAGIKLVITAGEEMNCQGAKYLAGLPGALGEAGAIVVGEPTSNLPLAGHKGVLWLEATTKGKTAHGSTPEKGESAIYKAARAIASLEDFDFGVSHALMGKTTLNIGTMSGGENINSVPDHAQFTLDIRTIPNQKNEQVFEMLKEHLGGEVSLRKMDDAEAIFTEPENAWLRDVFEIVQKVTGQSAQPAVATYFTDGSALKAAMGNPPTIILGPGEAAMAHQTDEYCYLSKIDQALEAYLKIGESYCFDAQ